MATNTNSSWLQNPLSVFMIIIPFLLLHAHNVKSLSFTFRVGSFGPNDTNGIIFQGDAFASNGALYLTKMENGSPAQNSVGRASYGVPIRLWDAKTGELAGFTTFFDFVLAQNGGGDPLGDGITFFIAPFQSNIPNNSCGGYLGLVSPDSALNSYQNPIVAVEFDTFSGNDWDPQSSHIGIDVNSIVSRTTEPWETSNGASTSLASAAIKYEAVSKELSVSVSYVGSKGNETPTTLSYVIDLRTVLPEFVRVGFSGSTGNLVEMHRILDWTFTSTF